MKKIVSLALALCMLLSLTAVFAEDWTAFEGWMDADWDAKTVKYQFTGKWDLDDNDIHYEFLINLYEDGSALVDQRRTNQHSSYCQFGYWTEETTEDGNEIAFTTLFCTPLNGTALVAHEYSYDLYEEEDGNYSFGYTFGIIPGQYFRDVDMAGGAEIAYETLEAFHTAVDVAAE